MTDKDILFAYRLKQAEETLLDSQKMLQNNLSPKSVINRAYYVMFYAVLALFIKNDINLKTSKHSGIISIFDKEFVQKKKISSGYSKMLHKTFKARQEGDYKELVEMTIDDASYYVTAAKEFLDFIKTFLY